MNMNTFAIICLFLKLTILNAATIKKTENAENLYDVLVKNCASLNLTDTLFKSQDIIKNCGPWKEINETKVISEETAEQQSVRCLLYYESFMSLCTALKVSKLSNVTVKLVPDVSSYKLEQVCKNRALLPSGKTLEHDLNKMITSEDICKKLCLNWNGTLNEDCALAYYFANYNVTTQSDAISKTNLPKQKLVPPPNQAAEIPNVQNSQANSIPQNPGAETNEIHDTNKEPTQNKDGKPPKPRQSENEKPPTGHEPGVANGSVNIVNQPSGSSDSKNSSKPVPNASKAVRPEISGNDKESAVKEPSNNPNLPDNEPASNSEKAAGGTEVKISQQSTPPKSGGEEENIDKDKDELTGDQMEQSMAGGLEDAEEGTNKDEEGQSDTGNAKDEEGQSGTGNAKDEEGQSGTGNAKDEEGQSATGNAKDEKGQSDTGNAKDEEGQSGTGNAKDEKGQSDTGNAKDEKGQSGTGNAKDEKGQSHTGNANEEKGQSDTGKLLVPSSGGEKNEKPGTLTSSGDLPINYNTAEELDGESYFFSYFMVICVLFVLGYVGYHNRQKVMALMLEGKRGRRQVRSRRPNSANYHKLDSNLEEAISSSCTKNSSHVIY